MPLDPQAQAFLEQLAAAEAPPLHELSVSDGKHPLASPLQADHVRDLPPALVITAEFDALRDAGEAYVARLREAGIPVTLTRYDGMIHGFVSLGHVFDQGRKAITEAGTALRTAFAK